jgi:serine/threonine protein kinase
MTLRKGKVGVSMLRNIGLQLLNKLGHLHSIGVVHNDIKPCNILFGRDVNRNQVYLIDFGLASLPDSMTEPQPCQAVFTGNIPFSPINTLKGNQSQPLDDLCSLSYLLLWMAEEGKCSWQLQTSSPRAQTCNC